MRNTLMLVGCLLLLTACASDDDYFGGNHRNDRYDDRYDGRYGGGYGYGNYYPYGNPYYARDRIYIIDRYHPCSGYAYQGYCYRYKDDYRNAIAWDRSHGYDDNWHKKRKDWCKKHDCSHDRDRHDRDQHDGRSSGKMLPATRQPDRPANVGAHDNRHGGRTGGDAWQQSEERRPVERHERPSTDRQPSVDVQQNDDRAREYNNRQRHPGNYQSQPRQDQPRQNQPRQDQPRIQSSGGQVSQENRVQESRSRDGDSSRDSSYRSGNGQERQSQRGRAARSGVTPE